MACRWFASGMCSLRPPGSQGKHGVFNVPSWASSQSSGSSTAPGAGHPASPQPPPGSDPRQTPSCAGLWAGGGCGGACPLASCPHAWPLFPPPSCRAPMAHGVRVASSLVLVGPWSQPLCPSQAGTSRASPQVRQLCGEWPCAAGATAWARAESQRCWVCGERVLRPGVPPRPALSVRG